MVIWGGSGTSQWNTGARYAPATDTWTATSMAPGVPSARSPQATVYTGSSMIVWSGGSPLTTTGGTYCACPLGILTYRDADGDGYGEAGVPAPSCDGSIPAGFVADGGDCNDASASAHPGAIEVCDGLDNDCNGTADDGIVPPPSVASVTMAKSGSAASISWSAVPGAVTYDVVEGSLALLAASGGDFTSAVTGCVANDLASTSTSWSGGGSWILVRAGNCAGAGTFDEGSASQQGSRDTEIAASGSACP
jgi:hypothetical protein